MKTDGRLALRWGTVAALALSLALGAAACSGRYGALQYDTGVMRTFEAAQVLPGHRYYTTGSDTDPAAIVALREDRPLRGAWREITATPALLKKLADTMRGTRIVGPDGAAILDDKGERIGVWYSYHRYPAPPKLLDDGGVELMPPSVPSDGSSPVRQQMRD